jgi:hypothetical protein
MNTIYIREISDLGHFGGGSYSILAVESQNIPIWVDSDIQTPSLANYSDLAPSQTTAT